MRSMTVSDRKQIRLAMWADSINERMGLVDRIWRRITDPLTPHKHLARPKLIQVVRYGDEWAYPLYLDGTVTRVLPHGGVPVPVTGKRFQRQGLQLNLASA